MFLKYGDQFLSTITQSQVAAPTIKTYRNEDQGFEFKYPSDWSFHENTFRSSSSKFNLTGAGPKEGNNPNPIRPSVLINIVTKDFAENAAIARKNLGATISSVSIGDFSGLKYEYTEQIPKISVDVPQDSYNFIISASKKYEDVLSQILASFQFVNKYEINSHGELIKQLPSGKQVDLVSLSEMESGFEVDNWSSDEDKIYSFIKGKVLDYWVSPDGNYIVYSVQDGLVSCCMAPPTGESSVLKIMKSDGSEKRLVGRTPRSLHYKSFPGRMIFDGWLSDSKSFVFHDQFSGESTGGSPFFLANVDGSPNQFFDVIDYGNKEVVVDTDQVIVALAEPYLSPKDNVMVYRKEGIFGDKIIFSNTDGTDKKVLLDGIGGVMSHIKWSSGGEWVDIIVEDENIGMTYRFNKKGERIK